MLDPPMISSHFLLQLPQDDTYGFEVAFKGTSRIWINSLIIPAYVALASAGGLGLQAILSSTRVQSLWARFVRRADQSSDILEELPPATARNETETNLASDFSEHVKLQGGLAIFAFQLLRLLSCAFLLALSISSAMMDEGSLVHLIIFGKKGKRRRKRRDKDLSDKEWIDMILTMTNFYVFALSVFIASSTPKWIKIVTRHLNVVLLSALGVYMYRDIYPLITFDGAPMDKKEGWVLWAKIASLFLSGCLIPITIPRRYTPVDPTDPMPVPNPEQTASILSFILFSFLDPIISLGRKIPAITTDRLPPLADYDRAKYLKLKSFPHLETFPRAHRRHLFFGLMRTFRREYSLLSIILVFQALASFASPLGIRNLLHYLETDGEGSTIRPWFWVVWLFFGPLLFTLANQLLTYIGTHTLVQTESIITQLVFEHSLRVRIKAEASDPTRKDPVGSSTASITETQGYSSESATLHSQNPTGSTIVAGSSDVKSTEGESDSPSSKTPSKPIEEDPSSAQNLVGKINNLVTTDLGNIVEARGFIYLFIYIPIQIVLCIVFLYNVLGWSCFVGVGVMILLFPLPGYTATLVQGVQAACMQRTDARVQTVSETMNVLRMIKLFGWEKKTEERIAINREEELLYIWRRRVLDMLCSSLNFVIPVFIMVSTYGTFTIIMKKELTASIVFSSMSVFDILESQLHIASYFVGQTMTGKVSLDRVHDFLVNTELLDQFTEHKGSSIVDSTAAPQTEIIGFREASFTWSTDTHGSLTPSKRKFVLRIANELVFPPGQLSLVLGPTGSGKTSLLLALLGEMHYQPLAPDSWVTLPRSGGIAYASQESWVQNETIMDNILFGSPFDEERYNKVVYQCSLTRDLRLLDAGDQTEVGEKGITLSGGQKARITLARAIYSQAKILLLDDVLAALDVHTAKWIVEKCFDGDLVKDRTVILVTHNVALSSSVARFAVSLGGDGQVLSQGSISEALQSSKELVKEFNTEEEMIRTSGSEEVTVEPSPSTEGKLILAEESEEGHVSWNALTLYLSALGGKYPFFFFTFYLAWLIITDGCWAVQTWFLGYWASQYTLFPANEVPVFLNLGIYGVILLVVLAASTLSQITYLFGTIRASRAIHQVLIRSILGTTFRWLDTTPISRVLTRCTQDIRAVDGPFSYGVQDISALTVSMLIKLAAVVLFTPVFLLPGVLIALVGGWCGQMYIQARLSVKREMSNAKAPVLGHFGAAIAGLTSLRAYGAQQNVTDQLLTRIDHYTRSARIYYNLNRWVAIRIEVLGGLFAAGLAGFLVYFQNHSASNTGFSLNMAIGFSGMILNWIRVMTDVEVNSNSLERLEEYIQMDQEPVPTEGGIPPAYWPADGSLHVENLTARYSADGPSVLHDISFDVQSGERIGIVGRTGSGKSSLTLALLRCILTEGKAVYAGLDTNTLNLDALRSSVTIIPQVPELISGTLRENLDPFNQYDDATLNNALRSAGLFSLQEEADEAQITLDSVISSAGGNLSVGQRQIVAFARAVIRGSKLLILDEATSAIDHKTDAIIQSSMKKEFGKDVTILTVAHRLRTIIEADKIMVLDAGRLVEFDKPSVLLKNSNSMLRALVEESSDKELLLSMAGMEER